MRRLNNARKAFNTLHKTTAYNEVMQHGEYVRTTRDAAGGEHDYIKLYLYDNHYVECWFGRSGVCYLVYMPTISELVDRHCKHVAII